MLPYLKIETIWYRMVESVIMDWSKYASVYEYISRLPKTTPSPYVCEELPHQQSIQYARKPNPIRPIERVHLEFSQKQETVNPRVHTGSLWSVITSLLEESHLLGNPSMKKCNVQFVSQSLQTYLTDKTIYSFLTGRRVYPLLELLDKPYVLYEKKHQSALGYFLSFLLHKSIMIEKESYAWSRDCEPSTIHLQKNKQGFWSLEKEKKIENV